MWIGSIHSKPTTMSTHTFKRLRSAKRLMGLLSVRTPIATKRCLSRLQVDANPHSDSLKPVYFSCGRTPGTQGLYLAYPAVDVAFFLNLTDDKANNPTVPYLHELRDSLAAYDHWMWTHRNDSQCCSLQPTGSTSLNSSCCPPTSSTGSGPWLWSVGICDTGEDGSDKFADNAQGPIQSMDMMAYSVSIRRSLARIARLLGDAAAEVEYEEKADSVAATLKSAPRAEPVLGLLGLQCAATCLPAVLCGRFRC